MLECVPQDPVEQLLPSLVPQRPTVVPQTQERLAEARRGLGKTGRLHWLSCVQGVGRWVDEQNWPVYRCKQRT